MPANSLAELQNTGSLGRLAAESRRQQGIAEDVRLRLPEKEAAHMVASNADEEGATRMRVLRAAPGVLS